MASESASLLISQLQDRITRLEQELQECRASQSKVEQSKTVQLGYPDAAT